MNVTELDIEVFNYSELSELKGRIEARMHDMQETECLRRERASSRRPRLWV